MFSSTPFIKNQLFQQVNSSQIRQKTSLFIQQSTKKDRENFIRSQRYLNSIQTIDYSIPHVKFLQKLSSTNNSYTFLHTLFQISDSPNWRIHINKMYLLISTFHNMITSNQSVNINSIINIPNFQTKFYNLFLLKDQKLHLHLMLLLKLLLAYNKKYQILNEQKVSISLASCSTYNNIKIVSEILWVMAQIEVDINALIKLFKLENLSLTIERSNECLLPFLTVLSNFLANKNKNQAIVQQLVTSNTFQKAFKLGINHPDINVINQSILIFNNALCYSQNIRNIFLSFKQIIKIILSKKCQQSQITLQIFDHFKININLFIVNQEQSMNIESIQIINFNPSLKEFKQSESTFNSSIQTMMG